MLYEIHKNIFYLCKMEILFLLWSAYMIKLLRLGIVIFRYVIHPNALIMFFQHWNNIDQWIASYVLKINGALYITYCMYCIFFRYKRFKENWIKYGSVQSRYYSTLHVISGIEKQSYSVWTSIMWVDIDLLMVTRVGTAHYIFKKDTLYHSDEVW